jgi:hypothetical protein
MVVHWDNHSAFLKRQEIDQAKRAMVGSGPKLSSDRFRRLVGDWGLANFRFHHPEQPRGQGTNVEF